MARTLAQERDSVRSLAGLTKATPDEVDGLINEGHKELCVRSEWTRATLSIGPTVAGLADYPLPANVYRPRWVRVNGVRYIGGDQDTADDIRDSLAVQLNPFWYFTEDEDGAVSVTLSPAPDTPDLEILANCTVYPDDIEAGSDDATFKVPDDFVTRGVRSYVKRELYSGVEDDEDRAAIHDQKFENEVVRLRQHRTSRRGTGVVQMGIEGVVR